MDYTALNSRTQESSAPKIFLSNHLQKHRIKTNILDISLFNFLNLIISISGMLSVTTLRKMKESESFISFINSGSLKSHM
jgi:hypothetical protein